ncbi:hypothetical protein GF362_07425 [Candidatus Dojkabacteria bacterium]|nr:hypothetical protein [Candidatus Dojkabacteria bacterium]
MNSSQNEKSNKNNIKSCKYSVNGMHCSACEIVIEKELLELEGVESVNASVQKGEVEINYQKGRKPDNTKMNGILKKHGYRLTSTQEKKKRIVQINQQGHIVVDRKALKSFVSILILLLVLIAGYLLFQQTIEKSGLSRYITISPTTNALGFFLYGIFAGASTCAALVGGVILSMSKQWNEIHSNQANASTSPHVMFHIGRLVAFPLVGGLLALIGGVVESYIREIYPFITLGVATLMLILGLQMLGVNFVSGLKISTPKFLGKYIADESNFKGKLMPFIIGAFSFLLPCGMTFTAMLMTLSAPNIFPGSNFTGRFLGGALNLGAFALGTLVFLAPISFSSIKLGSKPHFIRKFNYIVGVIVIGFGLLGLNSFISTEFGLNIEQAVASQASNLPEIKDGKQILKMDALAGSYEPRVLKVRAGVPVVWEVTNQGVSGCSNEIIAKDLFEGSIDLKNVNIGQTATKEFLPKEIGRYTFSCWMGMINGVIDVVDEQGQLPDDYKVDALPTQGQGCGGGCNGGCGGGCGNPNCGYSN